ncbi:Hypothetical predicted protein [Cloeon dipterum]|uniref:Peptidase S1 domain-containing protein n=1 Tax=Cloeon dipterum TaxID=197152 RepID=A0A8S1DL32_9INSE|nr:Hypothetical predicted protein [Cloeon dipterum]
MLPKVLLVLTFASLVLGGPSRLQLRAGERLIIGGIEATVGEIPWQVSIQSTSGIHLCGGTIISNDFIVTSAYCSAFEPSSYKVISGTLEAAHPGSTHDVTEIFSHADYNETTSENDISIWRVNPPFTFDANTNAIKLPTQSVESIPGTLMTISGWGYTSATTPYSDVLLKVEEPIVSKSDCNTVYSSSGGIALNVICAGFPGSNVGACIRDTGGPLFLNGELRGIFNGLGCDFPVATYPDQFTEVSAYRDWINQITNWSLNK